MPDKNRGILRYFLNKDINGKYKINRLESGSINRSQAEAEYVNVHFQLPMDQPLEDGSVYVFGALTDWKYFNENKLFYNTTTHSYEATLFLKQGYYNYEYLYLKDGDKAGNEATLEGSHRETENDYTILVYHRPMSSLYDQFIGMITINTFR